RWLIAIGGVGVIFAVVLIFFYLIWVVFPLFLSADTRMLDPVTVGDQSASPSLYLSLEEQREIGLRLADSGLAEFFEVQNGRSIESLRLPMDDDARLQLAREAIQRDGTVAAATTGGRVLVFRHRYETRFTGGVETRKIHPTIEFPYGEQPLLQVPAGELVDLAFSDGDSALVIAAATAAGQVFLTYADKSENFLSGDITLESRALQLDPGFNVTTLAVSGNQRWLYLGDADGRIHFFSLPALEPLQIVDPGGGGITSMTMLLGGISVLAGDQSGTISQLFPVRGPDGGFELELIRQFEMSGDGAVVRIVPEQRRKGFLTLNADGRLAIFHSTSGRRIHEESLGDARPLELALAPRANELLLEAPGGKLLRMAIDNRHPGVSFASIWRKVWYENYQEPEYVWQSSAATNEFEPKFSLTPLVFGTLKAAFYAMLFAIPLALMGAAYTAYFMSPALRKWVKPGIEIMEALPTVILGFLAGLWFAPWVEDNLADIFMIVLLVPPGLLLTAWLWHGYDGRFKTWVPEGWEPLLQVPLLVLLGMLAMGVADPVQALFFQGDFRDWLSEEAGISYDQRNALVVGCAMGFAVIPTIFSIAEDAIFGVPRSLSNGSLALGATPWQTLVKVVLPTASPGIFSGLMIGLGRAVGETMIVLMATGNTPIMDWSLFEGMRTLAANIAVEMPESEVNSTHYRVLFLAGLVLFLFTFVVNTGAELVRQRLREKYSSL
ncbi:MAG: ABC transporter permease subunit, partial [Xanthomonadales bacterium]|nr:ABC transporter permease subunit [Xanthomonadales bacterium]